MSTLDCKDSIEQVISAALRLHIDLSSQHYIMLDFCDVRIYT